MGGFSGVISFAQPTKNMRTAIPERSFLAYSGWRPPDGCGCYALALYSTRLPPSPLPRLLCPPPSVKRGLGPHPTREEGSSQGPAPALSRQNSVMYIFRYPPLGAKCPLENHRQFFVCIRCNIGACGWPVHAGPTTTVLTQASILRRLWSCLHLSLIGPCIPRPPADAQCNDVEGHCSAFFEGHGEPQP